MAFVHVAGPHYIKRTLVYVDSADALAAESPSDYDFSVPLEEEIQQVFAIELVQFDVPRIISATWIGQYDLAETLRTGIVAPRGNFSNMITDIRITDETGVNSVVFQGNLDPAEIGSGETFPYSGLQRDQTTITNDSSIVVEGFGCTLAPGTGAKHAPGSVLDRTPIVTNPTLEA